VGRLGLIDAAAGTRLTELGWDNETHVELLWSLSRSPDADFALQAMQRLAEALGDRWSDLDAALLADRSLRGRLFAVLGSSLAFGDHLAANPQSWKRLAGEVRLPSYEAVRREFSDCISEFGPSPTTVMPKLRCVYRDRLMVLAALDLAPTVENEPVLEFPTVGAHLSDLADAALDAALQVAVAGVCKSEPPPRLAVIAMGKCGARELNYVSDVDIIFVGEDADALTTRVAGEMMRLASEAFFEVDAALRPEGKAGALVRTLESHIAYYQRWAKTWEFQALLKARAAIGDAELGRR
jgi:glutamate-ammonia-ligase adenylyltransferase